MPLLVKSTGEGFEVIGQNAERVRTGPELMELVARATEMRTMSSNSVHEHSSRSHAFLSIIVEKEERHAKQVLAACASPQHLDVGLVPLAIVTPLYHRRATACFKRGETTWTLQQRTQLGERAAGEDGHRATSSTPSGRQRACC